MGAGAGLTKVKAPVRRIKSPRLGALTGPSGKTPRAALLCYRIATGLPLVKAALLVSWEVAGGWGYWAAVSGGVS